MTIPDPRPNPGPAPTLITVVEDDTQIRELLGAALADDGYNTLLLPQAAARPRRSPGRVPRS